MSQMQGVQSLSCEREDGCYLNSNPSGTHSRVATRETAAVRFPRCTRRPKSPRVIVSRSSPLSFHVADSLRPGRVSLNVPRSARVGRFPLILSTTSPGRMPTRASGPGRSTRKPPVAVGPPPKKSSFLVPDAAVVSSGCVESSSPIQQSHPDPHPD